MKRYKILFALAFSLLLILSITACTKKETTRQKKQITETARQEKQITNTAVFFASPKSYVTKDPSRIVTSPTITSDITPTVNFNLAASNCKGSFEDKYYEDMEIVFADSGSNHEYTFGNLTHATHKVFVKCADGTSGYFDFVIVPGDYEPKESAAGNG